MTVSEPNHNNHFDFHHSDNFVMLFIVVIIYTQRYTLKYVRIN